MISKTNFVICDYFGLLALNKWGDGWSESHCSYDRKMHDDSEKCASKHECYKEQGSRSWMGESKWTRISIIVQNVDSKTKKIFISFEIFMLRCIFFWIIMHLSVIWAMRFASAVSSFIKMQAKRIKNRICLQKVFRLDI